MKKLQATHTPKTRKIFAASDGFTLIELMVTVAILGILVTAAVAAFDRVNERQRIEACATNLDTINIAISRAAAIYEKPLSQINDAEVSQFITGGISALQCEARTNPQHEYHVANGVVTPAHNHE